MPCSCEEDCKCVDQVQSIGNSVECTSSTTRSAKDCQEDPICDKTDAGSCRCLEDCSCISSTSGETQTRKIQTTEDSRSAEATSSTSKVCETHECSEKDSCVNLADTSSQDGESAKVGNRATSLKSENCHCCPDSHPQSTKPKPIIVINGSLPDADSDEIIHDDQSYDEYFEVDEFSTNRETDSKFRAVSPQPVEEEMAILDKMGEDFVVDSSCGIVEDAPSEASSHASEDASVKDVVGCAPLATTEAD